jgi:hypothetical protein
MYHAPAVLLLSISFQNFAFRSHNIKFVLLVRAEL